jgi:hypothetical protein
MREILFTGTKKGFVCSPEKRNGKMITRPELNHSELLAFSFPP